MSVISDSQELADFCRRISDNAYITVDTEFMRENTYWPQLCVVQLAGDDEAQAIDALAEGLDLSPLLALMADEKILKVFHAARQDLEIFFLLMGTLPEPLFDTQVAAMVCGFGDSAGYETLVRKLVGASIDKSSRFTDWARRPLTDKQIKYALSDVTHLRAVYEKLDDMLGRNGRREWLEEEIAVLTSPKTYDQPPEDAWKRLKSRSPAPRFLAILREVAAWREREAKARDLPRNRVLRDEALLEIAHHAPASVEQLARTRGLGKKMAEGKAGEALLAAVAAGQSVPEDDCPSPPKKRQLPRGIGPITDLLKVVLKMKSEQNHVAQKLIATTDQLEAIAAFGEDADVPALQGWRRQIFGDDALALMRGNLALVANGRELELVEFVDE
ncbi:MAG: ribonuclease D [Rhodospirillales bacterium]|jgi:ribonuclease D|nr:ribonuclease D [Rhodospirillales bacterium]MDP6646442.1 ribonuclease D [Rhodospirillales bacterium]MDP6842359.1 ribonuclease D [Rhodospirillales bacterium]|tara:strand:+ start:288 stop:1448 length:1161 start_codon:yes stop_codon:yes gene_type:complete